MPEAATWSTEQWMVEMVHDRIAAGETTVASTAAVLRCEKQMEKLPHYNFSWTVSLQKQRNSVSKRLWTCRERLILELEQFIPDYTMLYRTESPLWRCVWFSTLHVCWKIRLDCRGGPLIAFHNLWRSTLPKCMYLLKIVLSAYHGKGSRISYNSLKCKDWGFHGVSCSQAGFGPYLYLLRPFVSFSLYEDYLNKFR
jgi:hypothetical protein